MRAECMLSSACSVLLSEIRQQLGYDITEKYNGMNSRPANILNYMLPFNEHL